MTASSSTIIWHVPVLENLGVRTDSNVGQSVSGHWRVTSMRSGDGEVNASGRVTTQGVDLGSKVKSLHLSTY